MSHSKLRRSCFKPSRPAARHDCLSDPLPAGLHPQVPCQRLEQHHCMARLQTPLESSAESAAAAHQGAKRGEANTINGVGKVVL